MTESNRNPSVSSLIRTRSYWELSRSGHKKCLSEHFLSQALVAEELWPGGGPMSGDYGICRVILWGWCLWKGSERSTPTWVSDQQAGSTKVNRVKWGCHHILCRRAAEPGFISHIPRALGRKQEGYFRFVKCRSFHFTLQLQVSSQFIFVCWIALCNWVQSYLTGEKVVKKYCQQRV